MSMHGMEEQGVSGFKFDKTISIGHVLMIVTMLAAIVTAYATYKVTVTEFDHRLTYLENHAKMQDVLNSSVSNNLYSISRDLAVIKDRIERSAVK